MENSSIFPYLRPFQVISSTWLNNVFDRYPGWGFGLLGFLLGPGNLGCSYYAGFVAFHHKWLSGNLNAFVIVGPFSKTWNEKLGEQYVSSETHNVSRDKDLFTPAIVRSIPMGQSLPILAIN